GASRLCAFPSPPPAGGSRSHTITASYGGDSIHLASSASQTVTVSKRSPSTSVSCSPNPVGAGAPATCTAPVAAGGQPTPTGGVGFTSSKPGVFRGSVCELSGTGGSASCSVTFTPPSDLGASGPYTTSITADYRGDSADSPTSGSETVT